MRRFGAQVLAVVALAIPALATGLAVAGAQPALAKPPATTACQRSDTLAAAQTKHMYLPPAVLTAAKYHCAHHLKAADTVKEPTGSKVPSVKPNGPCTMPTGDVTADKQLAASQATCVAKWVALARQVTGRPTDCIKRDSAELQGQTTGPAFQQLDQQCQDALSKDKGIISGPTAYGFAGVIVIIGIGLIISGIMNRKAP
jgi:hypothetical protein